MNNEEVIGEFINDFTWLSNFFPCKIILNNVEFHSVEHAYMSEKSDSPDWKRYCAKDIYPGVVKTKSREVQLVDDWENKKIEVMYQCLLQKFTSEPLKTKLINTGGSYIREGNYHGDKFWGVCLRTGKGKNILGEMIMNIRYRIMENMI